MINQQRTVAEPAIMQRENERSRPAVDGKRTDHAERCTLVVVHEVGGSWAALHGADQLGVRLSGADAVQVARRILGVDSRDS